MDLISKIFIENPLLLIAIAIFIVLFLIKGLKKGKKVNLIETNLYRRKLVLTKTETIFFKKLREALSANYTIFAQVPFSCLVTPKDRSNRELFWRINQKRVDFVVLDENGEPKMKSSVFIRGHHVFNIEQCDGLEKYYEEFPEPEKSSEMQPRPDLDVLPNKMGMQLYNKAQDRACYIPRKDCIVMPDFKKFNTSDDYYATLLHECGHATGHKDRLNRDGVAKFDKFGSSKYAFEELIAELTSAFTCAHVNVRNDISQNAAYIEYWIKALKADKKAIFRVSSQAREATQFLLNALESALPEKEKLAA